MSAYSTHMCTFSVISSLFSPSSFPVCLHTSTTPLISPAAKVLDDLCIAMSKICSWQEISSGTLFSSVISYFVFPLPRTGAISFASIGSPVISTKASAPDMVLRQSLQGRNEARTSKRKTAAVAVQSQSDMVIMPTTAVPSRR